MNRFKVVWFFVYMLVVGMPFILALNWLDRHHPEAFGVVSVTILCLACLCLAVRHTKDGG